MVQKETVGIVVALGTIAIVLVVVFLLLGALKASDAVADGSNAEGAINSTEDAMEPIASTWVPLMVTFGMLGVIILLAFGAIAAFSYFRN